MPRSSLTRTAAGSADLLQTERVLALGRVVLAGGSAIEAWTTAAPMSRGLLPILAFYGAFSLLVLALAYRAVHWPDTLARRVYLVDLVWALAMTGVMRNQGAIFFALFLFVLVSAAYRWGLTETLRGAMIAVLLLLVESLAFWNGLALAPGAFGWTAVILRALFLVALALFIGSLTEEQRRLRSEAATIASLVAAAQEDEFRQSAREAGTALLGHFRASRIVATLTDAASARTVLCDVGEGPGAPALRLSAISAGEAKRWRLEAPERCDAFVSSRRGRTSDGHARWHCWPSRTVSIAPADLAALDGAAASAVLGATLREGPWTGQVLVLDPAPNQRRLARAAFLHRALRQAAPAFYRTYLARQLRQRAGAIERARVARELHDGVIQTLTGLDLQIEAVRRRAAEAAPALDPALDRIQGVLRDEVLNLRDLMQHLRHTDVDPRRVVEHMSDLVERFHRDTGITATFFSDLPDPEVPREVAGDLLRVLQEALINVRKHSGARSAVVRLGTSEHAWSLFVGDDGRGFPFEGRLTLAELDERRTGPLVLKERVRALGGTLSITSQPGAGASLDIVIPREPHVA